MPFPATATIIITTSSPTPTMVSIDTLLTPNQLLGGGSLGNLQASAGDGDVSPRSPRSPRTPGGSLRTRVNGVVKFFNPTSSFGYIIQDDGSEDLYVHAKALGAVPGGVLQAGDKVEYRVAVFNERPRAKDVRVLKRA